jgi:steroid delta-isomerase-like uncharacterized protein
MLTSTEENKALNRRVVEEILNTGQVELFSEVMEEAVAAHLCRDIAALWQAFPDLHYTIEDMLAEGDQVAMRFTITGTNTGPFQDRPATGKAARWTGTSFTRHATGKIVEQWLTIDILSLLQQLGIIPGGLPRHAGVS